MDPLQPIIPQRSDPQAVHALTRVDPTHRDGRGSGGQGDAGRDKRHQDDEDAVQVQIDGGEPESESESAELGPAPAPPARTLDDDGRPHIDLTA
jgi:hypothetical protein